MSDSEPEANDDDRSSMFDHRSSIIEKSLHSRHLIIRHHQKLLRRVESKLSLAGKPRIECGRIRRFTDRDVLHGHAAGCTLMPAPDVRPPARAGDDHGDTVQLVVARMKDVSAHAQCCSNAATRSAAIWSGERPSIWCRWTNATTSPSLSNAADGDDGRYAPKYDRARAVASRS